MLFAYFCCSKNYIPVTIRLRLLPPTLLIVLLFQGFAAFAQPHSWMPQPKPYTWMFGLGWNAVDDDGRPFCQPFDAPQSWHLLPYPTRLNVDRYLNRGFSVEFTGAYNRYNGANLVNGSTGLGGTFISLDLNGKYSFYNLLRTTWLDPYVSLGFGGTIRPSNFVPTLNSAIGVNFWVYKNWGVQLQTSAKFGITSNFYRTDANYLQHSAGIVYKIEPGTKKNKSNDKPRHRWIRKKKSYRDGGKDGG